ncbi:hypothetical protein ACFL2T_01000 [Elusimicrobiota bacterium]
METKRISLFITAILVTVLVAGAYLGRARWGRSQRFFDPLSAATDWRPQDHESARGITAVNFDEKRTRLVLHADLDGGSDQFRNGEAMLDLALTPGLARKFPVDMSDSKIVVDFEVPENFVGSRHMPNGLRLICKDEKYRSLYSPWHNVKWSGTHTLELRPGKRDVAGQYVDVNYDALRTRELGIQVGINSESTMRYRGTIEVSGVSITPRIKLAKPPSFAQKKLLRLPTHTLGADVAAAILGDGFVAGANFRVIEYAGAFGTSAWFPLGNGVSKHENLVKSELQYMRKAGIQVARIVVFADGRVVFDREGNVVGYSEMFEKDLALLLDLMQEYGVAAELVLYDYLIGGRGATVDGVFVRGRAQVISDPERRREVLLKLVTPMLIRHGGHPSISGFDIINEGVDWLVSERDGGGWESVTDVETKAVKPIPGEVMRDFLRDYIKVIRKHAPGKLITVGTSCKFAGFLEGLDLSYHGLHYYDWQGDFSSCVGRRPKGPNGKALPWVLEEFPVNKTKFTIPQFANMTAENNGRGFYLWNFKPDVSGSDGATFQSYEDRDAGLQQLRDWIDARP